MYIRSPSYIICMDFSGLSLLATGLTTGLALLVRALASFRFHRITMCSGGGGEGCAGVRCDCRAGSEEDEDEEAQPTTHHR